MYIIASGLDMDGISNVCIQLLCVDLNMIDGVGTKYKEEGQTAKWLVTPILL